MGGLIFLFVVCLLVAFVGIMALQYHQEKQRTEQMRVVAERMGFSFQPEAEPGLQDRLGHLHLFSQGHSRQVRNMMCRKIHDIDVNLFDYWYSTGHGKHRHTHRQTVLLFETERLCLPLFALRPEGLFHRIAGAFGYQDIDFETHPVFSETYLLQGHDEARIRALFAEEALSYYTRHENLCTEGEGQHLVFYRGDRRVEPGWMEGFLEQGLDVLDLFLEKGEGLGALPLLGVGLEEAQMLDDVLAGLEVEWLE